jgi:archaemetzincin
MRLVPALLLLAVAACGRAARPAQPVAPTAPLPAPDVAPVPDVATVPAELPSLPEETSAWTRLGPAGPSSWRERFPDDLPMSFDDYVDSEPVRADGEERVVAFQPVGDFSAAERQALDTAAEFVGIWFGLPVRVLPPTPLTEEPEWSREVATYSADGRSRQFRTGWFLNVLLPDLRPKDAVVLLGVTMADLYPKASWNYVFGEAHLRRRVGVYSLARYYPEFWSEERTPATLSRALLRTLKVVTHETGHTFGLEHCVTWACCMNGSNSLQETDTQPLLLCPECERKLVWNRGLDPAARAAKIAAFLAKHGFAEGAAWHRARAAAASAPRRTSGSK